MSRNNACWFEKPHRVLLLAPAESVHGGVVGFVQAMKASFSSEIIVNDFVVGDRGTKSVLNHVARLKQTFVDAWRLFFLVRKNQHDVIHINPSLNTKSLFRDGLFLLIFRVLRNRRTLVFFHGWDEKVADRISSNFFFRWLFKFTFGYAARIIVLTDVFRAKLICFGVREEKIGIMTTMFDGSFLREVSRRGQNSTITVLFLSRLIPEKGIYELLNAFQKLSLEYGHIKLVIAGDGPSRIELEERAKSFAVADRIAFTGYLTGLDKAQVLVDADIFVLPSYSEGCPVSVLEAMGAGLAVVVSPVGCLPNIITDGVNGVLLENTAVECICENLAKLILKPDLLDKIKATNKVLAWEMYEAGVVTKLIERYYHEILEQVYR